MDGPRPVPYDGGMTSDQYTQLIDFLGGKFERIDGQFEEAKREREKIREEARRHATVLFEQSQANLNTVAEGLGLRLERVESGLVVLNGSVESLDHRVGSLEETVGELTTTVRRGFADHERRIQVLEATHPDSMD